MNSDDERQEMTAYRPVPLRDWVEYPEAEMLARARAFEAVARRRRSLRAFDRRDVPRNLVETCIRTAGLAPNGANHQPWHFAAICDPERKRRIREAAEAEEQAFYAGKAGAEWLRALEPLGTDQSKPFLEDAPWIIAIFGQRRSRSADGVIRRNYYVPESVSIAAGFLIMALHNAGLATLTHTPAPMGFLNEICNRPKDEKPYLMVVTGFPATDATVPEEALRKRSLDEIASFL